MNENCSDISMDALDLVLRNFFENDDEMLKEWTTSPLPILSAQTPSQLFSTGEGRKKIVHVLGLMANGDTA